MKIAIRKLEIKQDERGWVFEPLGPDQLSHQRNVHWILTLPGKVRGNHWHQRGTEILVIFGPALVRISENGVIVDYEIPPNEAWQFTIPPGVSHAIKNTGKTPLLMIAFNSERYDPSQPDVVRENLISENE